MKRQSVFVLAMIFCVVIGLWKYASAVILGGIGLAMVS
jgi:hypothetical protein